MAKRYIVLAACLALVLVATQTPDIHAKKLPPGFVDQVHVCWGTGWDQTAACVPSNPSRELRDRVFFLWLGNFPFNCPVIGFWSHSNKDTDDPNAQLRDTKLGDKGKNTEMRREIVALRNRKAR